MPRDHGTGTERKQSAFDSRTGREEVTGDETKRVGSEGEDGSD